MIKCLKKNVCVTISRLGARLFNAEPFVAGRSETNVLYPKTGHTIEYLPNYLDKILDENFHSTSQQYEGEEVGFK